MAIDSVEQHGSTCWLRSGRNDDPFASGLISYNFRYKKKIKIVMLGRVRRVFAESSPANRRYTPVAI